MQKLACFFFSLAIAIAMTKGISDVTGFSLTISAVLSGFACTLIYLMIEGEEEPEVMQARVPVKASSWHNGQRAVVKNSIHRV